MPAKDVKAYSKRNKNDAADAEAICDAVRRPTEHLRLREAGETDEFCSVDKALMPGFAFAHPGLQDVGVGGWDERM